MSTATAIVTTTQPVRVRPIKPISPTPHRNGSNGRVPPLENGDRLSRAEFERLYVAHPEIKKAELIEGVVYMPSPVKVDTHGDPHSVMMGLMFNYRVATPGIRTADNATNRLDVDNEPQPDIMVWVEPSAGGQAQVDADGYLQGAPELIAEISSSSASYDLNAKRHVYRRTGVQEYIVVLTHEREIRWFVLQEGEYTQITPDADGVFRSQVFPGLWLNPTQFWNGDLVGVVQTLQAGILSPEHAEFVARLQEA